MRKLLTLIVTMIMCNAYGGTAVYFTTQSQQNPPYAASTCDAGGNITKPANPTKAGYRFMGWKEGTGNDSYYIYYRGGNSFTPTVGTNKKTWTVTNSDYNYTVTGEARCSSTTGTQGTASACGTKSSNPATSDTNLNDETLYDNSTTEPNCWCRVTNYAGLSLPNMEWVFYWKSTYGSSSQYRCATSCAYNCASYYYNSGTNYKTNEIFRACLLGLK